MEKDAGWKLCRLGLFILLAIISSASPALAKHKDDVVILKNGDRLTGEIKGLQHGELKFKASYMVDAVRLDWSGVEQLESKDRYSIALTSGQMFTESVRLTPSSAADTGNFVIGLAKNAVKVKQMEVLAIAPAEAGFWRQLEGSIDYGFNFTSGNNQYSTQLMTTATYRRDNRSFTVALDSTLSGQRNGTSSARNEFTFEYWKQLTPKWLYGGFLDLLRSGQQSLSLRTTVGGLFARSLVRSERTGLQALGGLAGTREHYSSTVGQPRTSNIDAVGGLTFNTFRFKTTDFRTSFLVYPSLTTPGRVRMQVKSDLHVELAKHVNLGFHVLENLDSKPPVGAKKNDLGVSTSLGWKF